MCVNVSVYSVSHWMNINLASFFDFWRNQQWRLNVTVGQKIEPFSIVDEFFFFFSFNFYDYWMYCDVISYVVCNICSESNRIRYDWNKFDGPDQWFCDRWFLKLCIERVKFLINLQQLFILVYCVYSSCNYMFALFSFSLCVFWKKKKLSKSISLSNTVIHRSSYGGSHNSTHSLNNTSLYNTIHTYWLSILFTQPI